MTAPAHDVVYVDLIEDQPMTLEEFVEEAGSKLSELVAAPDDADILLGQMHQRYLDQFQPFRWHATSKGNHKVLGQGERYFNEADAERNIRLQFSGDSIVYLRRHEQGNEILRMAYPSPWGDTIVIGPECFAATDGSLITWRGVNYVPQEES